MRYADTARGSLLRTSSLWSPAALSIAAVLLAAMPAAADGVATAKPAVPAVRGNASVSVDLSALEAAPRRLLVPVPGTPSGGSSGRVMLRPPAGVAPAINRPQPVRLRPPPGVTPYAPTQVARAATPSDDKSPPLRSSTAINVEPVKPPPTQAAAAAPAAPAKPVQMAAVKPQAPVTPAPAPAAKPVAPPPAAAPAAAPAA